MDDAPIPLDAPAPAPPLSDERTRVGAAPKEQVPPTVVSAGSAPVVDPTVVGAQDALAVDATIVGGVTPPNGAPAQHSSTVSPTAARQFVDPVIGKEIGGATIIGFVGEGGMGRVYLGEQKDPPRRVAVKLLSRGFDNPEAVGRFQREAAILDRLHHPGVAEILGHGVWDDGSGGIPYMLIELVEEAKTLADFAVEKRLDRRARLELFHRACEGIGCAHEMKILHRDLKPANLLADRWGRVKVIDFGVARAANGDLGIAGVRTETGQLIGTVQYMSPEQIAGDPRAIDLTTDVYALGVILYEMLLDAYPYDVRGLPLHEAARVVSEAVIEWPRTLDATIDEELEAITMRCLDRDRTKRFANSLEVADALGCYLSGPSATPVTAGAAHHPSSNDRPAGGNGASGSRRGLDASNDPLLELEPMARASSARRETVAACGVGGGPARRGWGLVIGVVIVAAAAGLIATGVVDLKRVRAWLPGSVGGTASPASAAAEVPALEPLADPNAMSTESLMILSAPAGATVSIDGQSRGQTPLSLMVTWNSASSRKTVEVRAPGFEGAAALVMPDPAGRRAEPLRLVFNLTPRGSAAQATLDRLLPLVIEGGPIGVLVEGGKTQSLASGRREVALALERITDGWKPTRVTFTAPGRRIEAFGRQGTGSLTVEFSNGDIGDQPHIVRITPS